jgi:hypothetical protein
LAKNYGNQRPFCTWRSKDLLNWLSALKNKPSKVFLSWRNQPADELRIKIKEQYGLTAVFHY